jgi:hypothetical protein
MRPLVAACTACTAASTCMHLCCANHCILPSMHSSIQGRVQVPAAPLDPHTGLPRPPRSGHWPRACLQAPRQTPPRSRHLRMWCKSGQTQACTEGTLTLHPLQPPPAPLHGGPPQSLPQQRVHTVSWTHVHVRAMPRSRTWCKQIAGGRRTQPWRVMRPCLWVPRIPAQRP